MRSEEAECVDALRVGEALDDRPSDCVATQSTMMSRDVGSLGCETAAALWLSPLIGKRQNALNGVNVMAEIEQDAASSTYDAEEAQQDAVGAEAVAPAADETIEIETAAESAPEAVVLQEAVSHDNVPDRPERQDRLVSPNAGEAHARSGLSEIAAEASEYSRRSFENGAQFIQELIGAKSFSNAVQIQAAYAKTSFAGFISYVTRVREIYSGFNRFGSGHWRRGS
ncbi:phasin family protein [Methylocapsa acidiphila]|uniref:phasin family protein n=1 Tax=Methylocapsa acidiphila TaxID=133552 RepID=UPI0004219C09|nr:phasin family protein [Methylocapsa acidiphila]